ncbi:MAG: hypothetical protein Q9N67_07325 [Ghiorsea sp.]|nr:hypothetical protein [Ghiorsea sp.]
MPEELVKLAKKNNCSQPNDFFVNKPGPIDPPYLYGVVDGNAEDSAVFWCVRNDKGHKKYSLMFMLRTENGPKLSGELRWINSPMGLSFFNAKNPEAIINRYVEIGKEDAASMPKDERFEDRYIMNSYDGVAEIFVMENGRWLVSQQH